MQLGTTVRDKITGFTGVVLGFVQYLSGCNQVLVAPPMKDDGNLPDSVWLDVQRVEIDVSKAPITLDNGSTPGFDRAPPKR